MEVPTFDKYDFFGSINSEQAAFLAYWTREWEQGRSLELGSNVGYLYEYLRVGIKHEYQIITEIPRLLLSYRHINEAFTWLCQRWISDYHLLTGDYGLALDVYPLLKLGATATHPANEQLNVRRLVGSFVRATDLFALFGPKLTEWGRSNVPAIALEFDTTLEEIQRRLGESLIVGWSRGENRYGWHLFSGISTSFERPKLAQPFYCYYADQEIMAFANEGIREAENRVRQEKGVPKVGEGWVSETTLYYQIRNAFQDLEVLHHARPSWIGRQHLDIYIPKILLALEYQGPQHDEPVDFFGGEEQWRQTKKRDAAKLEKCLKAGVLLICVREGYDLEAIIKEIRGLLELAARADNR